MTRKCSVIGCRTGYTTTKQEKEDGKGNFIKVLFLVFPKTKSQRYGRNFSVETTSLLLVPLVGFAWSTLRNAT